jgi:hypothetical protein
MLSFMFMAALVLATDCKSAKNSLEDFLGTLPKSCRVDTDCTGHYYGADSCAAPVVTNKAPLLSAKEKQLLTLQAQVRSECRTHQPGPACSPIPFQAQCVKNSCTDALRQTAPVPKNEYLFGTIHKSCAPWDGPALALDVKKIATAEPEAPRLLISIYKDIPHGKLAAPLTVPLDIHNNMIGAASRCPKPGGCRPASRGTVTLTTFEEGEGASGHYELHFDDGTPERGKFNLSWKNVRELCG